MHAFFLAGPTASGKTEIAQRLAEAHGYGILSADSMLIYRGMDIGTAKPSAAERGGVPYYGMDLASVEERFNSWEYHTYALKVLAEAERDGRTLIVVGGTGLYLKLLTHGLGAAPGPNRALRDRWERVLAEDGVAPLQAALREQSPTLFAAIDDPENGRRLVRFLEWAAAGLDAPPRNWEAHAPGPPMPALEVDVDHLKTRIEQRVRDMYAHGLLGEVQGLLAGGTVLSDTARQAIGYAEAIEVLEGRCTQDAAIERTAARTRQLAKRQRSWLRTQANVEWVKVEAESRPDDMAAAVQRQWDRHGPIEIPEG